MSSCFYSSQSPSIHTHKWKGSLIVVPTIPKELKLAYQQPSNTKGSHERGDRKESKRSFYLFISISTIVFMVLSTMSQM